MKFTSFRIKKKTITITRLELGKGEIKRRKKVFVHINRKQSKMIFSAFYTKRIFAVYKVSVSQPQKSISYRQKTSYTLTIVFTPFSYLNRGLDRILKLVQGTHVIKRTSVSRIQWFAVDARLCHLSHLTSVDGPIAIINFLFCVIVGCCSLVNETFHFLYTSLQPISYSVSFSFHFPFLQWKFAPLLDVYTSFEVAVLAAHLYSNRSRM